MISFTYGCIFIFFKSMCYVNRGQASELIDYGSISYFIYYLKKTTGTAVNIEFVLCVDWCTNCPVHEGCSSWISFGDAIVYLAYVKNLHKQC